VTSSIIPHLKIVYPRMGPPTTPGIQAPHHLNPALTEVMEKKRVVVMQRLRVAYNFGCRALYNLPWRASVSSHQVQCNITTFEALLRKYKHLFLERCRKSNNVWLRALIQSDCLYSSLFFEHYNRILLCD